MGRPNKPETPAAYKAAFIDRVIYARKYYSENAADMARALGMEPGSYNRYEKRSMMPHHLIPKFCRLCRVEVDWLIGGPQAGKHARTAVLPPDFPQA